MNLPNLITIARILLVPFIIWLIISGEMLAAFVAFLVAGISDGVDGFLAKRWSQVTSLGAHLDPLARQVDDSQRMGKFIDIDDLNCLYACCLVKVIIDRTELRARPLRENDELLVDAMLTGSTIFANLNRRVRQFLKFFNDL